MARRTPALVGLGLALSACGTKIVDLRVDPAGVDVDVGFFVQADDVRLERFGPAFGLGTPRFGRPTFDAVRESPPLYLVALRHEDLEAVVPGYDLARIDALQVARLALDDVDPFGDPAHVLLPDAARLYRVDLETGALAPQHREALVPLSEIGLYVPRDPVFCARGLPPVQTFGATGKLLETPPWPVAPGEEEAMSNIVDLVPLDADRVVALTSAAVLLVDRGGHVAPPDAAGPKRTLLRSELEGPGRSFEAMAYDRSSSTLWIAGVRATGGEGRAGDLLRVRIDADGLTPLESIFEDTDGAALPRLEGITLDRAGDLLVVADDMTAYRMPAQEEALYKVPLPEVPIIGAERNLTFVTETGDPSAPHFVGIKGDAVLVGDFVQGTFDFQWVTRTEDRDLGVDAYLEGGVARPTERWAVGRGGVISQWTPQDGWVRRPLPANPRLDACTQGSDINGSGVHFTSIAVEDDYTFVVARQCNALLALDRKLNCTAMLELPGEITQTSDGAPLGTLVSSEGRLWMAGAEGRIFTVERP